LTTVSIGACVAGGALVGDGVWSHSWEVAVSGMGALAAGAVGVVAATVRYALRAFDARTRAQLQEISELQRRNDLAMQQREHQLFRREEALKRQRAAMQFRAASSAKALDETRNTLAALRTRIAELEQEVSEVNDERNQLILNELVATRGQFEQATPRGYGRLRVAGGGTRDAGLSHGHERIEDIGVMTPEPSPPLRRIDTS